MATTEESKPNNGVTEGMSKTEASYKTKGDKSYYYWHPTVTNKVPIDSPPLLEKKTLDVTATEPVFQKVLNYSWMDDDALVKVFIDLAKLGDAMLGAAHLPAENVSCQFFERGFDLAIKDYKGGNHQLKISNLRSEIDTEKSTFRVRTSKIIISLSKKDGESTWFDLLEKKR